MEVAIVYVALFLRVCMLHGCLLSCLWFLAFSMFSLLKLILPTELTNYVIVGLASVRPSLYDLGAYVPVTHLAMSYTKLQAGGNSD